MKRVALWLLLAYLIVVTVKATGYIHVNQTLYLSMCGLTIVCTMISLIGEHRGRKGKGSSSERTAVHRRQASTDEAAWQRYADSYRAGPDQEV